MRNRSLSLWLMLLTAPFLLAPAALAVTNDWVTVGNPGNTCDPERFGTCYGAVNYTYQIARFETTNADYARFLNATAAADPNGVYDGRLADSNGGILRSGATGSYRYAVVPGREQMPVNYLTLYSAMRYANWMQNGQPTGAQNSATTEDGSYTFTGRFSVGPRNASATIVLPTNDEWYKAAFYNALSSSYFDYPAGSNTMIICAAPGATPNTANCGGAAGDRTDVGSYTGSPSPYGTFDQGGNVSEWTETLSIFSTGIALGGDYTAIAEELSAWDGHNSATEYFAHYNVGFRVAMIPEPGTGVLVMTGLLGLAYRQRRNG